MRLPDNKMEISRDAVINTIVAALGNYEDTPINNSFLATIYKKVAGKYCSSREESSQFVVYKEGVETMNKTRYISHIDNLRVNLMSAFLKKYKLNTASYVYFSKKQATKRIVEQVFEFHIRESLSFVEQEHEAIVSIASEADSTAISFSSRRVGTVFYFTYGYFKDSFV